MAISRINGKQIRHGVLTNQHVAEGAAIDESKLAVNWESHYAEALESKKVVDYVQVNSKEVEGTSFNLSADGTLEGTASTSTSIGTEEGIITDAPYNKSVVRDAVTGDSILDEAGEEVYGRIVHDGVDYKVMFVSQGADGEVPFEMPAGTVVDFQYMERFNLHTISELFAANEKFVAGAADVTAFQNLHQLAKDIYGAGYTLDRDGKGNLQISLKEQISNEQQARVEAITKFKEDLAAQGQAGLGAHLIGLQDVASVFTSGTVEGALNELETRLKDVEESGGVEVKEARVSNLTGAHESLDQRIEADVAELEKQVADEKLRAETAEGVNAEAIAAEKLRAEAAEGANAEAIAAEKLRAEAAEEANAEAIAAEKLRAEAAELANTEAIAAEKLRAEAAELANAEAIAAEKLRAEAAELANAEAIAAEKLRAEAAEGVNAQAIADEAERAVAAEEAIDEKVDAAQAEIEAARGSKESLDQRLDVSLNEDGTLKSGQLIHAHHRARFQAIGGEAEVLLSEFTSKKTLPAAFHVGDDSLQVFINGQLQEEGLNYHEAAQGNKVVFDMGDGTVLEPGDLVQVLFHINNPA